MPKKRRTYHHGNLKRALMDAALELITEGGPDAFTMAAAGRQAGVSSGAPYRHFVDRRALLAALAEEGIDKLEESLAAAVGEAGDGQAQLEALGIGHVEFAATHPAYFRVMNTPEYLDREDPEVLEEAAANDATLKEAAGGAREAALRLGAQAAIYGLARMLVDGHFSAGTDPEVAREAARIILAQYTAR